jgi:uncharacterized glyoxalase superfamily protein PhnB
MLKEACVATLTSVAPEIPVNDMERGIEYYEAKLGFTVEMRMPQGDYAIVERDDVSLHLFKDASKSQSPVSLHIFAKGLDDLYAELEKRGAHMSQAIAQKPWGTRDFRVMDPSGNEIKFTEPMAA